jgi:hypothetical protein
MTISSYRSGVAARCRETTAYLEFTYDPPPVPLAVPHRETADLLEAQRLMMVGAPWLGNALFSCRSPFASGRSGVRIIPARPTTGSPA